MILKTSQPQDIKPFLEKLVIPQQESHKGQNGKALIIGGSTLFHAASLWAAEVASHFLDMVHYSSTEENLEIFTKLKTAFRNGIIVHKKDLLDYVAEDDAVLIGPGMVRSESNAEEQVESFDDVLRITDEAEYGRQLTYYLLKHFPDKKFVIDAGALQMMDADWLKDMNERCIVTPHQGEFEKLFREKITELPVEEKAERARHYAKEYHCTILLKAIDDIITDGEQTIIVQGGNQGLTKGGSGDVLAGLTVSFFTKNDALTSAVVASYMEKLAADDLKRDNLYWYNMIDLIHNIPKVLAHSLS